MRLKTRYFLSSTGRSNLIHFLFLRQQLRSFNVQRVGVQVSNHTPRNKILDIPLEDDHPSKILLTSIEILLSHFCVTGFMISKKGG